jgi:hypothetical protein
MAPKSDDEARPHLERICADAGFNRADQCSGDRTHEANTKLPAADKDKKLAELRKAAADMPKEFPEGYLQLMNANRDRRHRWIYEYEEIDANQAGEPVSKTTIFCAPMKSPAPWLVP